MNRYRLKNQLRAKSIGQSREHAVPGLTVNFIHSNCICLHEEYWNDQDRDFIGSTPSSLNLQLTKTPSFRRRNQDLSPKRMGRWIVKDGTEASSRNIAWVEVHQFFGRFSTSWVYFHIAESAVQENPAGFWEGFRESFSYLFTAFCMSLNTDILITFVDDFEVLNRIPTLSESFTEKTLWTFKRNAEKLNLEMVQTKVLSIGKFEWLQCSNGKKYKDTLSYLEKRNLEPPSFKKRYRPSVFGLFFPKPPCC